MESLAERKAEILDEFMMFDDWMQKYEHIIELGKELPLIDEQFKTEEHLIKGCQSRVWLHANEGNGGTVHFTADSDAIITKGLIALMIRYLGDLPAKDVAQADMGFIQEIGLQDHLSPTRSNGLVSMVKQMKLYGMALAAKQSS
ncbi:MAG: SufE family protein [Flavobacteriales bacterium]|jgi:cysteine desulfuration protein SufE|nr:SufE family protein [Flavobacteriales bacterium]MDP4954109.1 SufE family protein [Flavobacteriales bacterium]